MVNGQQKEGDWTNVRFKKRFLKREGNDHFFRGNCTSDGNLHTFTGGKVEAAKFSHLVVKCMIKFLLERGLK